MNRRQLLRGVFAATAVGIGAGCAEPPPPINSDVVDPGTPGPSPSPSASLPAAPLSGVPASGAAVANRPALAVPIRVTPSTTPVGLASADVIFQEYAESSGLHLSALFHSRDASKIGPVTEIRPVDVRTLGVIRPFVAYDGGPTGFIAQFEKSGLTGATPSRQSAAFHGDYTSTSALYRLAPSAGLPPSPIFDYAAPGTPLAAQDTSRAAELSVAAPGRSAQVWRYDAKTDTWRGPAGKATVAAASVIVLTMPYRTLSVRKPSFRSLPSANVFGEGAAVAVSGPYSAKARWRKRNQKSACNVLDLAGNQIRPQPGTAWVVYAPPNAKITVR